MWIYMCMAGVTVPIPFVLEYPIQPDHSKSGSAGPDVTLFREELLRMVWLLCSNRFWTLLWWLFSSSNCINFIHSLTESVTLNFYSCNLSNDEKIIHIMSLLWHIGGYPRTVIDFDFKLWIHITSTSIIHIFSCENCYPTHCVTIMAR